MTVLLTKAEMHRVVREAGIVLRRTLGQNFLFDHNLIRLIPELAQTKSSDVILEVGAGLGNLTRLIAEKALRVIAVEVDPVLAELCAALNSSFDNITLINTDILSSKHDLNPEVIHIIRQVLKDSPTSSLKMISNLPYSIATPVLLNVLESELPFSLLVVTIQREVADRFLAKPGERDYGPVAIFASILSSIEYIRTLPPQVFWPKPKVESTILKFTPHPPPPYVGNYRVFKHLVTEIFRFRRKTLSNAIHMVLRQHERAHLFSEVHEVLKELGIDDKRRPQDVSVSDYAQIARRLTPLICYPQTS